MTNKDFKVSTFEPNLIMSFSKPKITVVHTIHKNLKLSDVKLHVKAYPYKHLDNDCVASKRLYLFEKIYITNSRGSRILEHNLPEVIDLDDDYSIKLSDILHDDMIVEGLNIYLTRNDRPFEITELYFQYKETDEEITKGGFSKIFDKSYNNIPNGQEYSLYMGENKNFSNKQCEFNIQRIIKENDIYYISKCNYLNDIEWILVDDKVEIKENIQPLEKYIGHNLLVKIKSTSNVMFLYEIKRFN
jgi:hypothetical protein